jgi:hypothetical protein
LLYHTYTLRRNFYVLKTIYNFSNKLIGRHVSNG